MKRVISYCAEFCADVSCKFVLEVDEKRIGQPGDGGMGAGETAQAKDDVAIVVVGHLDDFFAAQDMAGRRAPGDGDAVGVMLDFDDVIGIGSPYKGEDACGNDDDIASSPTMTVTATPKLNPREFEGLSGGEGGSGAAIGSTTVADNGGTGVDSIAGGRGGCGLGVGWVERFGGTDFGNAVDVVGDRSASEAEVDAKDSRAERHGGVSGCLAVW